MSQQNESQFKTFTAGEALGAFLRVKFDGTNVVYADAGEDYDGITQEAVASGAPVTCRLKNGTGTVKVVAAEASAAGATLYGADHGKVQDTSSGSAQFKALEAATDDGDVIEALPYNVKSTTAATVSIADAGTFTAQATVEAALQEIYQHLLGAQGFIPIPMNTIYESDATNMTILTGSTTPILDMIDGDTDSSMQLLWAASNSDAIIFQTPLPPDLDTTKDVVIHFRGDMAGAVDTPTIASDAYFNEGDTKVEDVSAALGAAFAEKTITIAAADVPSGAQTLTVELTPGAHTTDILYISAIWIEYTRAILTA